MEKVSVAICREYKEEILTNKLRDLLDGLGGLRFFVKPGQKVLLKVNLLMGKPPEAAVTTNPLLVKIIARMIKEIGADPIIGDSPGGPFNKKLLKRAYRKTGLAGVAEQVGAELNYNVEHINVPYDGSLVKSFVLGKFVTEADVIINLAKLKTHGLTMFSGAVKNLFGTIPGLLKAEYHLKMPRINTFAEMLIDLSLCINPALNIVDGVWGMEGEGPSAGEPRNFAYLLASSSSHAVDTAASFLLGITPVSKAPVIQAAMRRALAATLNDIDLTGNKLIPARNVKIPQYIETSNLLDRKLPDFIVKFLTPLLRPRPVFNYDKCVGCGDCFRSCPPQVITLKDKKPTVSLKQCIRCFCCQELCKYQAVDIERPFLGNLLAKCGDKLLG